jgi:hypothetical protein
MGDWSPGRPTARRGRRDKLRGSQSQMPNLEHPSIIAGALVPGFIETADLSTPLRSVEKHLHEGSAEPQVLRSASLRSG